MKWTGYNPDAVSELWDKLSKDWNDYEALFKWSALPIVGGIFRGRQSELEYEENKRYWSDYARNWGIDTENWKYPIRMGLYGNSNPYGSFEAGVGIAYRQFSKRLYKW